MTTFDIFKAAFKYELKRMLTKRNIIIYLIFLTLFLIFVQLEINRYKKQLELQKAYNEMVETKPL